MSGTGPASRIGGDERPVDGTPLVLGDELGVDQVVGEERPALQRDHRVHGARTAEPPATQVAGRRLTVDANRGEVAMGAIGVGEIVEEAPTARTTAAVASPPSAPDRRAGPDSSNVTSFDGSALSRAASTQPADPPPTMVHRVIGRVVG